MSNTTTLRVSDPYLAELAEVRALYAKGRAEMTGLPATSWAARESGWHHVAEELQWSITHDVANNAIRPGDVELWRRIDARRTKIRIRAGIGES